MKPNLEIRRPRGLALLLLASLLAASAPGLAATGTLTGFVLDARTGQPVRGARLEIRGEAGAEAGREIEADLNGVFISPLASGTWVIVVKADGYQSQRITGVEIGEGAVKNLSLVLEPTRASVASSAPIGAQTGAQQTVAEEITVTAEAIAATEQAMLTERRSSAEIVDNIGAEEISKNTGSDAAGVLKRVTGISLQDDKYVYVRGLGERYSNTTLNGSKMPSTEFERKVVPLDLFAADLLEKITVRKSYSVDQPGDFVAGAVELLTKNFPANQKLSIGLSGGFNDETTGEPLLSYGGGVSFSGGGGQPLPGSIPSDPLVSFNRFTNTGFTSDELESFGEALIGEWQPRRINAPVDQGFKLSYGNSFDRFGMVLSAGWDRDQAVRNEVQNFYAVSRTKGLQKLHSFDVDYGEERVRKSLMGNFAYRIGDNTQIQLRGLGTNLSNAEGREQFGFFSDENRDIRDYGLQFKEQDTHNYQLSGNHFWSSLGSGGSTFEWKGAVASADTAENLRQVTYSDRNGEYTYTNLGQSGFFFFNDLKDDLNDSRVDWSTFFSGDKNFGSLEFGAMATSNDRDFRGRRLRFVPRSSRDLDLTLPPDELFSAENISSRGFEIREVTNPTDAYQGTHDIYGAYAQADWTFGDWRVIGGARLESSKQQVDVVQRDLSEESSILENDDILPSVAVVYSVTDRQQIRGSLSRTVNRPEYRELAPFRFKPLVAGFLAVGNPDLVQAEITSYDVRWEWFPSGGEVVAVSLFYKGFNRPIEQIVIGAVEPTQTYLNAMGAENVGAEIEIRRSLGSLFDSLESFTGILNYTYVESTISIDPNETVLTNTTRPLTGQPANVVNAVLEWAPSAPRTLRLLFNYTDDKIFLGGANGLPDIVEADRSTLDLVFQQAFGRGLNVKTSFTNLTSQDRTWLQGGEVWRSYKPGLGFGLSFGYSF